MPGCAPEQQHGAQQGRVLRLTALELEGFKSFRDRAVIGPLDDFTCVVGPNGCGKSVVGEAVAFALGGNRKMLRAGSVAALLNQELAAAGHRTAEVVLHMELLQHSPAAPRLSSQKQLCSSSPSQPLPATNTSTHSPAVTDQPHPTTTTTSPASTHVALDQHQQQSNSQQPQPQQMKLRRVLRGDVTKSYIMRPGSSSWTAVTQAQLQTELAPYGIDTQCIDRYIVTQSRQAVDVSDAVGLVKQLEGLTGAVDYEEAIARHSTGLEHLAASMEETKAHIGRLEDQRELLAPAVTHWQEVQQLQEIVSTTKLQLLTDQQAHGSKLLVLQAQQVEATADRVAGAAEALESARTKESELLQQRAVLDKELLVSKRREEQLVKQVSKLSAAAASAGVQHSSAVSAAKDNSSLMKALQKKLAQHDQQEAQHKTQVEEGTEQLRVLQEAAAAAQEQLAAARTKAAAAARTQPGAKASNTLSAAAKEAQQQQQSLQQQLSDLTCQAQLLIARQAAATSKATRAAKAVDALQQRTEAAAAAAAGQARGLSEAEQEVQAAAAAVAASRDRSSAAEERWRAAELQQQTLLDQLRDFQQQQQQQGQQQHNTHTAPETSPSYDTAVQHLTAASSGGQLPGQFYGRLCNLAAVRDASAQPAVNAVLRERCNLATMMVVSDRATAAAVIDHFRQQRIGTVNCKILSELQQQRGPSYIQPAAAAAGGGGISRPLLDLVQYDGTAVPGLQQLMEQLLGGWLLVESREVALQLLHLRKSMVTRSGEVFKADGEIVASFGGPPSNSSGNRNTALAVYSLATGAPVPIPTVTASNNATGPRPDAAAAAASRAAAAEDARRLKQQLAAVQQQLHAAEQECQAARLGVLNAEQQQAAAEGKLQRLRQQQRHGAGGRAGSTSAEQVQQQLQEALQKQAAAAGELTAAEAPLAAVLQQREQLQHELTAVTAAAAAAVDAGRDKAATAAAVRLQEAEQAAGQAEAAVEEAWQLVHKAEQQQKRAAGRAAAISKEVAKVQAALDGTAVEQLQAKVDLLRQQLSDTQSELQHVRSEAVSISSKVKPVRKQLAKAAMVKEKAAAVLDEAQANQQQAQAALKELQQQQEHRAQLLSKLQPRSAPFTAAASDATAAAAAGHKKARTGSSCQGDDRHGSGSGGEDQQQQQEQQQKDQELQDVDAGVAAPTPAAAQGDVEMGFPAPAGAVQGDVSQGDMQADRQGVSTEKQHKRRTRAGTSSRKGSKAATLRRSTRARVIQDSSSSSGADDELSSSSSEEEEDDANVAAFTAASRTRRAAAAAPPAAANTAAVSRAGVRGGKGARAGSMQAAAHNSEEKAGAVAAMRPVLSAAVLGKQTALLQQRQQQLDEQELELLQEYAKVDKAALQQDLAALQGLAAAHSALQQLQQQREAATTALEALLDERYSRLLAVLQQLNSRLDAVCGQLTGGCGKAYCSYTAERRLLFSQGVTLHVQPDGSTWRRMGMLSGGQRSLATLALSFALQALFPSPFYFFDEVDCALDTSAAARVAAYVRQQCSGAAAAQYLLVSHKPVVFESAGCLLGVYSNGRGSSAAVVGHFGRQEAGA